MPRGGLLVWSPFHKPQADKLGREVQSLRAGRRTLEEAAEKVGVGVSQPRRRRRKKEVGELRRIIPSCQLWSGGREPTGLWPRTHGGESSYGK